MRIERDAEGIPARLWFETHRTDCLRGIHSRTFNGEPQFSDNSVEVDEICSVCEMIIATVSWTKAAWEKQSAKQSLESLKQQGELFQEVS